MVSVMAVLLTAVVVIPAILLRVFKCYLKKIKGKKEEPSSLTTCEAYGVISLNYKESIALQNKHQVEYENIPQTRSMSSL